MTEAVKEWNLPFEKVLSDPTHKLLKALRERKIFSVVITGVSGDPTYDTDYYKSHKLMGEASYPYGCAQPGLLVLGKELNIALFNWHIEPAEQSKDLTFYFQV